MKFTDDVFKKVTPRAILRRECRLEDSALSVSVPCVNQCYGFQFDTEFSIKIEHKFENEKFFFPNYTKLHTKLFDILKIFLF